MSFGEREEFIIMLLLENLAHRDKDFLNYMYDRYEAKTFNDRYKELLDKFLEPYALNKTEKSEENISS